MELTSPDRPLKDVCAFAGGSDDRIFGPGGGISRRSSRFFWIIKISEFEFGIGVALI